MEEKLVLGSRLNGEWLSIILKGDTTPTFLGKLAGRSVPQAGSTIVAVKELNKNTGVEYTNYYW
jgi:hypothetical protein